MKSHQFPGDGLFSAFEAISSRLVPGCPVEKDPKIQLGMALPALEHMWLGLPVVPPAAPPPLTSLS